MQAVRLAMFLVVVSGCNAASSTEPPSKTEKEESDITSSTAPAEAAPVQEAKAPPAEPTCRPKPPASLEGTKPILRTEPDHKGRPIEFECFEGCGASCEMQDREEDETEVCQDSTCASEAPMHRVLRYRRISGGSQPFCAFHDRCYYECHKQFEIDDPDRNDQCTRFCDFACVNPDAWDESQKAGSFDSDTAPRTALGSLVLLVTGSDEDKTDYVKATKAAGLTPASRHWDTAYCLSQATTALGANPLVDIFGGEHGTITFTAPLNSEEAWAPGTCKDKQPKLKPAN